MEPISIRYGEGCNLPIDANDFTAISADIYIGNPGQMYVLTANAQLTDGVGVFEITKEQTEIPLGTYSYQINVTDANGAIEKYPQPQDDCGACDSDFPKFIVAEALDRTEIS